MLNNLTLQDAIEDFYMYNDRVLINDGAVVGIETEFAVKTLRTDGE